MLPYNTIRTFTCPKCGAILCTGAASCDTCSALIDADAAEAAADRREQILKANGEANNLVITARTLPLAFGLTFVPFLGPVGVVAVAVLLVQVPFACVRWYLRYRKLSFPEPELVEARRWWKQSLAIWSLAVIATPIWMLLRFSGGADG